MKSHHAATLNIDVNQAMTLRGSRNEATIANAVVTIKNCQSIDKFTKGIWAPRILKTLLISQPKVFWLGGE